MYELTEIVESMMLQKSIQPLHTHGAMVTYKCLWSVGDKSWDSSLQEGALHTIYT